MSVAIVNLTFIGLVLLLGIVCTIIALRTKISSVLLLLVVGIILGNITYSGRKLIAFSPETVATVSVLAIAIIVFDGASRLKLKEFDEFAMTSAKLSVLFLLLSMVGVSLFAHFLLGFNLFNSLILGALMAGTAPEVVFSVFENLKTKAIEVLEIESIVNTPLVFIIPFIILDFQRTVGAVVFGKFFEQILPFFQQIFVGIGSGVVIGLIVFKIMRRYYSSIISPIAIATAALLTYGLSESIGGNGVLGVTTLGIMFGTVYIKEKTELESFSGILSNILKILVFIFVGMMINIYLGTHVLILSLALFMLILFLRFISIQLSLGKEYNAKEKLFMTFVSPKGVAVATVALIFSTLAFPGAQNLIDVTLLIMFYSILVSSIFAMFPKKFSRTIDSGKK